MVGHPLRVFCRRRPGLPVSPIRCRRTSKCPNELQLSENLLDKKIKTYDCNGRRRPPNVSNLQATPLHAARSLPTPSVVRALVNAANDCRPSPPSFAGSARRATPLPQPRRSDATRRRLAIARRFILSARFCHRSLRLRVVQTRN